MYEEHLGVSVDDIVIMMVAEDGQVNLFEKKTADYVEKLQTIMDEWYDNFTEKVGIA
jgi:ClpP class serine protease